MNSQCFSIVASCPRETPCGMSLTSTAILTAASDRACSALLRPAAAQCRHSPARAARSIPLTVSVPGQVRLALLAGLASNLPPCGRNPPNRRGRRCSHRPAGSDRSVRCSASAVPPKAPMSMRLFTIGVLFGSSGEVSGSLPRDIPGCPRRCRDSSRHRDTHCFCGHPIAGLRSGDGNPRRPDRRTVGPGRSCRCRPTRRSSPARRSTGPARRCLRRAICAGLDLLIAAAVRIAPEDAVVEMHLTGRLAPDSAAEPLGVIAADCAIGDCHLGGVVRHRTAESAREVAAEDAVLERRARWRPCWRPLRRRPEPCSPAPAVEFGPVAGEDALLEHRPAVLPVADRAAAENLAELLP